MWEEFRPVPIDPQIWDHFWTPDTYFVTAKQNRLPSGNVKTKSLRIQINTTWVEHVCLMELIGR
jgi:hypothetical protein